MALIVLEVQRLISRRFSSDFLSGWDFSDISLPGLGFGQNLGWEMGFEQNVGWEMGFIPPLQDPPRKVGIGEYIGSKRRPLESSYHVHFLKLLNIYILSFTVDYIIPKENFIT